MKIAWIIYCRGSPDGTLRAQDFLRYRKVYERRSCVLPARTVVLRPCSLWKIWTLDELKGLKHASCLAQGSFSVRYSIDRDVFVVLFDIRVSYNNIVVVCRCTKKSKIDANPRKSKSLMKMTTRRVVKITCTSQLCFTMCEH